MCVCVCINSSLSIYCWWILKLLPCLMSISSVTQSCPTLCDPMDCSTPGLPVHHQVPVFTQSHVHWIGDAIQASHPLFPLLFLPSIFPRIRVFSNESVLHMEKAMATHSSTLAWKIPWTEEPGRLQSMGLLRVGHDWVTSLSISLFTFMHWRRKWQPTPVFLPGEF